MRDLILNPVKLPEWRAKSVAARESDAGRAFTVSVHQAVRNATAEEAVTYAAFEERCLREAELFHVSAEMSRFASIAGQTMTEFHTRPWDAPCQTGLIWFDAPIGTSTDGFPIRAASWRIQRAGGFSGRYESEVAKGATPWVDEDGNTWGAWVTFYTAMRDVSDRSGEHGALSAVLQGPLSTNWELAVALGDIAVQSNTADEWLALVSAWLLMGQRVADVSDYRPTPAVRRKYSRRGYDQKPVRVVTLSARHEGATERESSDRHYRHRWVVRGHWRNQWYPKQERHIPIWITPHVKGPSSAPLLDKKEVVYSWK